MKPTCVYDSYWRFAAERHAMYLRRLNGDPGPWTRDPILRSYRFTNTYRAADRVSQYLIREVQYRPDRSQVPTEVYFRTILFKLFNKIETWEAIEDELGPISWQSTDLNAISEILDRVVSNGSRIYSAAYIMPSPNFGHQRKHRNHLALLSQMMHAGAPSQIERAHSLRHIYELLRNFAGLGPFLAFQYTIDLNYSSLVDFDESAFVVAGPGALDGIKKCFYDADDHAAEDIINWMVERQDIEFEKRGLDFPGLFGRKLQPIDCQNLFCEISKYARVAHPEVVGTSKRVRIKQGYHSVSTALPTPFFPPRWELDPPDSVAPRGSAYEQLQLWA